MDKYEKIIALPHHISHRHPPMAMLNRAAQFSPFAALSGYEAAVSETARLTDARLELTEDRLAELDQKQQRLMALVSTQPTITVTFFVPDERKSGGCYRSVTAPLRRIDTVERIIHLSNGSRISLDDVIDLQSEVL